MKNQRRWAAFGFVFVCAGAAFAANDEWPVATQATTQSCWRAAADGKFSAAANWQHVEKVGSSWTWSGAEGSVPVISSTDLVNGFLFNKASDYEVDVDAAATVNYLYAGQDKGKSEAGAVSLLVTNDLTFASPNASWTNYRLQYGDVQAGICRLGLDLNGPKVSMTVKDGATLAIKPEYLPATPNKNNYCSAELGHVRGGATLYVTNATLSLDTIRNSTYGNQHHSFRLEGTTSATSTLHMVDATLEYTGNAEGGNYRNPFYFSEYTRGVFTDTTMNMTSLWDLQPKDAAKPNPEILINGNSVYNWKYPSYGTFLNGGHVVFDDNAQFLSASTTSSTYFIGPALEGGTCHLEFLGNSSANFNKACNANEVRVGNGGKKTLTTLDWHSAGTLTVWTALRMGYEYGEGRLNVTNGLVRLGGYGNIYLGTTSSSKNTDQCVTGRLDVAGGVIDANAAGKEYVQGLVVGGAYDLRAADATDYYAYGEVNISGDSIVSNKSDVWIGTGFAKGVFRMTGGRFFSNNILVLGAGGGDGEMHILGGSYEIRDVWDKGPTTTGGGGSVYIGGISVARMQANSRYKSLSANFPHSRRGTGYLCVSNANFFVGVYGTHKATDIGSSGTGVLELKNGAYYDAGYLAMTNGANGTLKFTLAGDTAPQMRVFVNAWIGPKAKLVVDARGYTGKDRWIRLIKFNRDLYPNKYWDGWGCSRNPQPADWKDLAEVCDRFDEDAIETVCDPNATIEIVQVFDSEKAGRAAGVWAHLRIRRGAAIFVR